MIHCSPVAVAHPLQRMAHQVAADALDAFVSTFEVVK